MLQSAILPPSGRLWPLQAEAAPEAWFNVCDGVSQAHLLLTKIIFFPTEC